MTEFIPEIQKWSKWKVVWINSDNIKSCLDSYAARQATAIGISTAKGFRGTDLSFLSLIPELEGLVITFGERLDLGVISSLERLKLLVLGVERPGQDFSKFPLIEELSVDWKSADVLPQAESKLGRLSLWGFSPKSRDLQSLPPYGKLTYLHLVQGSIATLDGIERFKNLIEADFAYLRQLKRLAAIGGCSIETLTIQNCRKIEDFASLAKCPRLKLLRYLACADVPSLAPLRQFKALEEFRFGDTNVIDGDMMPLLKLKSVGFTNKRHFSHTNEQIAAAIGDASYFEAREISKKAVITYS